MPAAMIQGAPAYYWERDYDRITQALMGLNQMLDEREKEKERRKARDMAMLQDNPRMAAGPAGKQFAETYSDDPQAIAFVQSLAAQGKNQMDLEAGQSSYFNGLFEAQQAAGRRAAEFMGVGQDLQDSADLLNEADFWIGNTPDPAMSPGAMMGSEIRDRIAFNSAQEDPRWTAYSGLPPEQMAQMGPWLAQKGQMPMPKILGVGMEGVDPKMAFAAQAGVPAEDLYNMFLRDSGLMPSVNVQAQIDSTAAGRDFTAQQAEEEYKRRLALEAERRKTKQTPPGKAPGAQAGVSAGGPMGGKGTDEVLTKLTKEQAALVKAEKVQPFSSEAAQEVARILGENTQNGTYAASKAASKWREIMDRLAKDQKFAQTVKMRGDTPESLWILWAQGFVSGQYK